MPNNPKTDFEALIGLLAAEDLPHLKSLGRRERRAAETRLRLFRSALALFAEHGFSNVTVEDITEAADVGKGTFFNYFESKDDVLGVMAEIQLGKVREALETAKAGKRPTRDILRSLLQRVAEEPARSPELARALISSFLASDRIRQLMDRNMSDGRRMLAQIFQIGQKKGEIDKSLKTDQLAQLFQQSFLGAVLLWSLHREPKLQNTVEMIFQHFWKAVSVSREE